MLGVTEPLLLADIVGAHGIKGWVKLRSYLEDPAILTRGESLILTPGEGARTAPSRAVKVIAVKAQGKGLIACLADVTDRNDAESLRGWSIKGPASCLPEAGDGEYYWRDLVGLRVLCRDGEQSVLLGEIDYLLETGSNDVMVVKATHDSVDETERLIPWLPDTVVTKVDLDNRTVTVDWYLDA